MDSLPDYVIAAGIQSLYIEKRLQDIATEFSPFLIELKVDIHTLVNQSELYFSNGIDRPQMYRVCSWYGKFNSVRLRLKTMTDIHQEVLNLNHQLLNWPQPQLSKFGKWMGLKSVSTRREVAHIQLLSRLLSDRFEPASLPAIRSSRKNNNRYLVIDYDLLVYEDFLGPIHRNNILKMAAFSSVHLRMAEKLNGYLDSGSMEIVVQNMVNAPLKDESYVDIMTMGLVSRKKAKTYLAISEEYLIVSQSKTSFDKILLQIGERISRHGRSGKAMIDLISSNLNDKTGYVNLDTKRVVKSPVRGKKLDANYRIMTSDQGKMDYYLKILKKYTAITPRPASPKITRSTKPRKRKAIPSAVRCQVWRAAFDGSMDGRCFSCHCKITFENWDCGHIRAQADGGEDVASNLRPLCRQCNVSMGTQNMLEWMKTYDMPGSRI